MAANSELIISSGSYSKEQANEGLDAVDEKNIDTVPSATAEHIAFFDADGNVQDLNVPKTSIGSVGTKLVVEGDIADGRVLAFDSANNVLTYVDVASGGTGDMTKLVYDTNDSGVVDNSEQFGGRLPNSFANVEGNGTLRFQVLASASIADAVNRGELDTDLTEKVDKVVGATVGNFASFDSNGAVEDSTKKPTDFLPTDYHDDDKIDTVAGAVAGDLPELQADGSLLGSGIKASDVVTDISGKADKVVGASLAGQLAGLDAAGNIVDAGLSNEDITNKASKIVGGTDGNLVGLDGNGEIVDSGKKPLDFMAADARDASKVDKVLGANPTAIAVLTAEGGIQDSIVFLADLVPKTRTINGQDLSADVLLSGADIGADIIASGLNDGGTLTEFNTTTITIEAGGGYVVNAYTDFFSATFTKVVWETQTFAINMPSQVGSATILIDGNGAPFQVAGAGNSAQRRANISLGFVEYANGTLEAVVSSPDILGQGIDSLRDLVSFLPDASKLKGLTIEAVTGQLQIFRDAGEFFRLGSNWHAARNAPNITPLPNEGDETTPATFDVIDRNGNLITGNTSTVPKTWDDNGTVQALGGQKATNHRTFVDHAGSMFLQLGQEEHGDATIAKQAIIEDASTFVLAGVTTTAIGLAVLSVGAPSTNFDVATADAYITNGLSSGSSSGGDAGTSDHSALTNRDIANQHIGSAISYDNTLSGMAAEEMQAAIDELALGGGGNLAWISTTLTAGGVMTKETDTTIAVTAGSGVVVDSTTDPLNPVPTDVTWPESLAVTIPMTSAVGVRTIFINTAGTISQVEGSMTEQLRRDNIRLGTVYYAGGVIQTVRDIPNVRHQSSDTLSDYLSFLSPEHRSKGMLISKVDNQLSIYRHVGKYFQAGVNWAVDRKNPNEVVVPQLGDSTTPVPFATMDRDLNIDNVGLTTIPLSWDDNGVITDLTGNDACIHYLYGSIGGDMYLQYGQTAYNNFNTAVNHLNVDLASLVRPDITDQAILFAQIIVSDNAVDFEDASNATIINLTGATGTGATASPNTDAVDIDYNNGTSGLTATEVQSAIDEVVASKISKVPATNSPLATLAEDGSVQDSNILSVDVFTRDGAVPMTGALNMNDKPINFARGAVSVDEGGNLAITGQKGVTFNTPAMIAPNLVGEDGAHFVVGKGGAFVTRTEEDISQSIVSSTGIDFTVTTAYQNLAVQAMPTEDINFGGVEFYIDIDVSASNVQAPVLDVRVTVDGAEYQGTTRSFTIDKTDVNPQLPSSVAITTTIPAGAVVRLQIKSNDAVGTILATTSELRVIGTDMVPTAFSELLGDPTDNPALAEEFAFLEDYKEPVSTSLGAGGETTITSATQVSVAAGDGIIVNNYTNHPDIVTSVVTFVAQTITIPVTSGAGQVWLFINSAGVLTYTEAPTHTTLRTAIFVGRAHWADSILTSIVSMGIREHQTANSFIDLVAFLPLDVRTKGLFVIPTTSLQLDHDSGSIFSTGANWENDRSDPNIVSLPAEESFSFDVLSRTGELVGNNVQDVIVDKWDNNGTVEDVGSTGFPSRAYATIQYLYVDANHNHYVELGQKEYDGLDVALAFVTQDLNDHVASKASLESVLMAQIVVNGDATNLSDTEDCYIVQRSTSTSSGSTAGGSTASAISYDNGASELVAINVQQAIDEVVETKAELAGDATQVFKASPAIASDDVVVLAQLANKLTTDGTGIAGFSSFSNAVYGSQQAYDDLVTAGTVDADTYYVIV